MKPSKEVLLHTGAPRTVLEPTAFHGPALKNLINCTQDFQHVYVVCFHLLGCKLWESRNYVLFIAVSPVSRTPLVVELI